MIRIPGALGKDLCDNSLGDEGGAAIAKALEGNAVLTSLNLSGNQMTSKLVG